MNTRAASVLGLALAIAIPTLWLLVAGPVRIGGWETNSVGFTLLAATSWGALYALFRLPRSESDSVISPGEWRAWAIGLLFAQWTINVLVTGYTSHGAALLESPYKGMIVRNTVLMTTGFMLVYWLMSKRWAGEVEEDERDREISRVGSNWGFSAVIFGVLGLAVMLGLSPADNLAWVNPATIAHLLIFFVSWGGLVQCTVMAIQYWRDRR